ncbi:MAG: methyltransferase domain-containing protein [Deltaproteobacteria bacterium]|nr:methyltransferase domain-containing protein [Deltaproteobacteria bacterium]
MGEDRDTHRLFDDWPEKYERWFTTSVGKLVRKYEGDLLAEFLQPKEGEEILDAGSGTGVFTLDILERGARVTGLDISLPMLKHSARKCRDYPLYPVAGDMIALPFKNNYFDKAISVTALEFIPDAGRAVQELFRVVKPGGIVVVATLNSLSPWAARRSQNAKQEHTIFESVVFRSPDDLRRIVPLSGVIKTAIHFLPDIDPARAEIIEQKGKAENLDTGAFVAGCWEKPRDVTR